MAPAENVERKDFLPSEIDAIRRAMLPAEKAAAKKRASAKREDRKTRLAVREMRKNGDSLEEIARKLNEDGHVTATGKRFHRMTVKRILERNGQ